jgi:hypothetical protein
MPWINNDTPEKPLLQKISTGNFELTYSGNLTIKGFGLLTLEPNQAVKFTNAQLVQILLTGKTAPINLSKIPESMGKRVFAVTIDINNNISDLIELK